MSRTLAAHDTSVDAVLKFQVREDELLTRLKRPPPTTPMVIRHRFKVHDFATKRRATTPRTCAEARSSLLVIDQTHQQLPRGDLGPVIGGFQRRHS